MNTTVSDIQRPIRGAVLAIGFATTLAMWAVAYVALILKPGAVLGDVLFAAMIAVVIAGGFLAGRVTGQGATVGAAVGLVSGLFNLLIAGSLLGQTNSAAILWWFPLVLFGSMVLGAIGALLGRMGSRPTGDAPWNWYAVFAKLTCAAALLLILSGGIVTGHEAGLAVPNWPNSFGHNMLLYPLQEMVSDEAVSSGVHYEHAHRLYGMLVGTAAITLMILIWLVDRRPWLRWLGVIALLLVIIQGILGGTRVTEESLPLAIIHGVFAQGIFALLAAIAAFMSTTWKTAGPPRPHDSARTGRMLTTVALVLLVIQLAIGAGYRHLSAGEPTVSDGMLAGLLHGHLVFGLLLAAPAAIFVGVRCWGQHRDDPTMRRFGLGLVHLTSLQVLLGFGAFAAVMMAKNAETEPWFGIAITSAHQTVGALVLAYAALLAIWTRRLYVQPIKGE